MSDYTPTTEEIRAAAITDYREEEITTQQFDRWLAEVKAQAWNEGFSAQLWSEQSRNPYRKEQNK